MARRPTEQPAWSRLPKARHWLIAALIVVALSTVAPIVAYLF
jgi:hypothetical protein